MKMTEDQITISKYKSLGKSNNWIAAKMGWKPERVEKEWKEITAKANQVLTTGFEKLCYHFQLLCQQYSLVGESLKVIATALDNTMPDDELRELIKEDPNE